ncbi:MAG: sugar phosphate isomerase/epimerase family protein [Candidatus Coatesbacteria bacterium]
MITLSMFADEITPDLEEALRVLKAAGLTSFELRGFNQTNVMKLSDQQVAFAASVAKREGFTVAAIASPIGKADVTDAFEPQAGQMKRAVELAQRLKAKAIRLFSFYIPKGDDPKKWRKEVVSRMEKLVGIADGSGVTVVLENEEGLYGDTIDRCADVIAAVKSPSLKLCYDPGNLTVIGVKPFTDGWKLARKHLGYIHVKDWKRETKAMVPAGQGDAEWPEVVGGLKAAGWEGVVALEPHLSSAGQFSGFTGPGLFQKAHEAFTGLLKQAGVDYR